MKKVSVFLIMVLLFVSLGASCGNNKDKISIGSKDFTESYILAELYALALEDKGFEVERKLNLGGTSVTMAAMESGDINIYPDYTGTCFINILKQEPIGDPEKVYSYVKEQYLSEYKIVVLKPAQANNSQALAMLTETSNKLGIKTISDLHAKADQVHFSSQPAFEENADGMPALVTTYGNFNFKKVEHFDNAIKYQLLESGKTDLVIAFGTDGNLVDPALTVLIDDKNAWPPYNIVPLVKEETLKKHPDIEAILDSLSSKLDDQTMRALNAKVDMEKQEPDAVAKEFFKNNFQGG